MGTVADVITAAFRRINVIESNAQPAPEDMADGFLRFKAMLGQWRQQHLAVPVRQASLWTISAAKVYYTYGLGGDINAMRPAQPNALSWEWMDASSTVYPLTPLTTDEYNRVPQKALTAPYPQFVHYRSTYDNPLNVGMGQVYLYPIPTMPNLKGVVLAPYGLNDPAAATSTLIVPDGYDLALMDNLARVLWPEWRENVPLDPELKLSAQVSLSWLKTNNVERCELAIDPMWSGGGIYDITSDSND